MCATCPTCGRSLPTLKQSKPRALPLGLDTSAMTDAEMRAYHKSTAPAGDLAAVLGNTQRPMPPDLRAAFQSLNPYGNRVEFYRQYNVLQARLREFGNKRDIDARHSLSVAA